MGLLRRTLGPCLHAAGPRHGRTYGVTHAAPTSRARYPNGGATRAHAIRLPRAAWLRTRIIAANARPASSSHKGSDDGPGVPLRDDDGGGNAAASAFTVAALQSSQTALRCVDVVLFAAGTCVGAPPPWSWVVECGVAGNSSWSSQGASVCASTRRAAARSTRECAVRGCCCPLRPDFPPPDFPVPPPPLSPTRAAASTVAYFEMLTVMTYNPGLLMAVVTGEALGVLAFEPLADAAGRAQAADA